MLWVSSNLAFPQFYNSKQETQRQDALMEKSPSLDESPFRPMGSQVLGRDWDAAVIQLVQKGLQRALGAAQDVSRWMAPRPINAVCFDRNIDAVVLFHSV